MYSLLSWKRYSKNSYKIIIKLLLDCQNPDRPKIVFLSTQLKKYRSKFNFKNTYY